MKKYLIYLMLFISTLASADFKMIVPQEPGGGTSVWATIIARELEKQLDGEKITIVHIPGAKDIPGFNKFHNELRKDNTVIMVSHGGNSESFLTQHVDYDYKQYAPIGLMNLNIIVGHRTDIISNDMIKFAMGSGMNPDMMAITMLVCGPQKSMEQYLDCFNKKVIYVPGFKGNERRLAYIRGELNVTRDTPPAFIKFYTNLEEKHKIWFHHGILNIKTGKIEDDKNFPGYLFNDVYIKKWGTAPTGDFYDAYLLVKTYRDVLQKVLWVDKNNPNKNRLIEALRKMSNDKNSMDTIEKDSGKYEWIIGDDVYPALSILEKKLSKKALKDLIWWNSKAYKQEAIYKNDLSIK